MKQQKVFGIILRARLTGAEPGQTLRRINESGVQLYQVQWEDELTISFFCTYKDQKKIAEICTKKGDNITFFDEQGFFKSIRDLKKRHIFLMTIVFLFCITVFLPTRVLFIQVEGNETIPEAMILEAASDCGIRFGVSRRAVRSERMKNALLSAMPQLQWAGINTAGCTAVISVRERSLQEDIQVSSGISHIVAARDGYITSCTVTRGNAECAPGQIVQEGQILISGYTDCGICIRVSNAEGEIFANTTHEIQACMPETYLLRQEGGKVKKRISLIIGKKRINLWKGSGIYPATCGRIYEEYYMTLPGGLRLPIRLSVETITDAETISQNVLWEKSEEQLKSYIRTSVLDQMVAGSILQEAWDITQRDGLMTLRGTFVCSEMIGRVITEEIGETNGKND